MLGDIDPLAPGRGVAQSGGVRAKWLIGLMGAGTLAPWNAWLLAYGYFDTVFGEHYNIAYVFTVCYFAPTALTILLMLRRTPLSRISVRARIVFAYITNTLLLLVPVVLVLLGTFDPEPRGGTPPDAFPWMVVVVVLSGMTTGILYGSLFSYITILPPSYTQACMSGIAASGMVLGCIWLLVRVVSGGEVRAHYDEGTAAERAQHFEVILFFVLAAATSAACLAAFTLFRKSELLSYYRDRQSRVPNARHSLQAHIVETTGSQSDTWGITDGVSLNRNSQVFGAATSDKALITSMKYHAFSVFLNFFVTTVVFPGLVTSQFHVALRGDLDGTIAEPLLVFAFLLFDFVGRQLPVLGSPGRFVAGEGWLVGFVLLRMGFVPLYAVVALSTGTSAHVPEFIVMIPFAFSHGYCSTVCMMEAPRAAGGTTDEAARQRASVIMAALTNAGICIGALVAFAWLAWDFRDDGSDAGLQPS